MIDSHIWLICMTLQGWSYTEVLNMPEPERVAWAERCEEYHEREAEKIREMERRIK